MNSAAGDFANQGLSSELVGLLILNELKCFRKELTNEVKNLAKKLDQITTGGSYCQSQPNLASEPRKLNPTRLSWKANSSFQDTTKQNSGSFKEISPESDNSILNNHIAFRMSNAFPSRDPHKHFMEVDNVYPEMCATGKEVEEVYPDLDLSAGNTDKNIAVTSTYHETQNKNSQVLDIYHDVDNGQEASEVPEDLNALQPWSSLTASNEVSHMQQNLAGFKLRTAKKKPMERHELLSKCTILYKCTVCNEQFDMESSYKSHYSEVHESSIASQDLTSTSFWKDQSIKNVFDQPLPKVIYICKICSRDFSSRGSLLRHSMLHSGVKKFVCKICGKRFFRSDHLKSHLPTHSRQKQFQCNLCQKYFSRAAIFEQHMKMHQIMQLPGTDDNLNSGTFDGTNLTEDCPSITINDDAIIVKTEQSENL